MIKYTKYMTSDSIKDSLMKDISKLLMKYEKEYSDKDNILIHPIITITLSDLIAYRISSKTGYDYYLDDVIKLIKVNIKNYKKKE